MNVKERIGETAGPYQEEITAEKLELFSEAVGWKGKAVPPTYITRLRRGEFELLGRLGVPLSNVLHGEQDYEYFSDLEVGKTYDFETKLTRTMEKRGSSSSLQFLFFESTVSHQKKPVARSTTTILVRRKQGDTASG